MDPEMLIQIWGISISTLKLLKEFYESWKKNK